MLDRDYLNSWIGKRFVESEEISSVGHQQLHALLGLDEYPSQKGTPIPYLGHWLHFNPRVPPSEIGYDGHPQLGKFLPLIPRARRMWAGSKVQFLAPIHVGELVKKITTIQSVNVKQGKTGDLVFVAVRQAYLVNEVERIVDVQDIVYRLPNPNAQENSSGSAVQPALAPSESLWVQERVADTVMMFRYSAVTFNGHRIHYDREYAQKEEGYPALVVHGPLLATLLIKLYEEYMPENHRITGFEFKAVKPTFDGQKFYVCGNPTESGADLWIRQHDGCLAMQAKVFSENQ